MLSSSLPFSSIVYSMDAVVVVVFFFAQKQFFAIKRSGENFLAILKVVWAYGSEPALFL